MLTSDLMPFWYSNKRAPVVRRAPFNSLLGDFFEELAPLVQGEGFVPRMNVFENEKELRLEVELPGLEEKDIQLEYEDGQLIVRGERKTQSEKKDGEKVLVFEQRYGSFERRLTIDQSIDEDKIDASFTNGVLHVVLPKVAVPEQKKRMIAVRKS